MGQGVPPEGLVDGRPQGRRQGLHIAGAGRGSLPQRIANLASTVGGLAAGKQPRLEIAGRQTPKAGSGVMAGRRRGKGRARALRFGCHEVQEPSNGRRLSHATPPGPLIVTFP